MSGWLGGSFCVSMQDLGERSTSGAPCGDCVNMLRPKLGHAAFSLFRSVVILLPHFWCNLTRFCMASVNNHRRLRVLGILLGVAIRTKKPLAIPLAPFVWKLLANMTLVLDDLEETDSLFTQSLRYVRELSDDIPEDMLNEVRWGDRLALHTESALCPRAQ